MNPLSVFAAGALAGCILALLLGGRGALRRKLADAEASLARAEAFGREQARLLGRTQSEQATVTGGIRQLPDVVRELNRSDLDAQRIPGILFGLAQDVFQPDQMLLYLVREPGNEEDPADELQLRDSRGLGEIHNAVKRIRVGEGRIGWAAENKVEMFAEDWQNQTRTEGRAVPENHASLRLDMIGPLVHYGSKGPLLLGVLCLGVPKSGGRGRDDKRMLQLISGLGSIALMNHKRVSELRAHANHDGLTGLLNKRHFMMELAVLIHKAERENQPLGVFIFDIDHFKKYNDTNGHMEGDELLKTIARVLKKSLRPGDLAGRYGGEEFLIAMPRSDREGALAVARRIRETVESYPFPHGEKQPLGKLTISGGVAAFPADGTQSGELIRGADQALYEAKRGGRNRVLPYHGVEIGEGAVARAHAPTADPPSDRPGG